MQYKNISGVPDFEAWEYSEKKQKYCLLIPVINEGERIRRELARGCRFGVGEYADIVICDGGSSDKSTEETALKKGGVNTLLVKKGPGRQGAQLRMGIYWALQRGYGGIITIDGNNKDSIENVRDFAKKLDEGYDFIQGSRFVRGGRAVNTPLVRYIALRLIHAPIISLTAGEWFTDTTNAFRGYSARYLTHPKVQPLRDVFMTYELLAYLSVMASRLGLKTCEIPVSRVYPGKGKTPTKISFFKGNWELFRILFANLAGAYGVKE